MKRRGCLAGAVSWRLPASVADRRAETGALSGALVAEHGGCRDPAASAHGCVGRMRRCLLPRRQARAGSAGRPTQPVEDERQAQGADSEG